MRDSTHEHIPHDACQKKDGETRAGIYDDRKKHIQAAHAPAVYTVLHNGVLMNPDCNIICHSCFPLSLKSWSGLC